MLGLITVGLGTTATNAQASPGQCGGTGRICVWTEPDFGAGYGAYANPVPVFPPHHDNSISSLWNRHSNAWVFYDGAHFEYPLFCVSPGALVRSLPASVDDRSSSATPTGSARCPAWIHTIY